MEQINEEHIRQRRSNQQIVQLLEEFEKSNVTVKDFCKQHHISTGNFHKWKSRYKSKVVSRKRASGFARVDIARTSQTDLPGLFAEVNGIRIYQPVAAAYLKELLA
jgi:hypothetical protein